MNEFQQLKNKTFAILVPFWFFFLLIGIIGVALRFITGEKLTGYGSYVPWGLWVALYFHGIGIGGGIFSVGVTGYIFGIPEFRRRLPEIILLSLISMICGLLAIWVDLGHPFRMWKIFLQPSFSSMLAFNSWSYLVFFIVAGIAFVLSFRHSRKINSHEEGGWLMPVLLLGIFLAIAIPSQSGIFFGVVTANPFWHSPLIPFLFFISSVVSGSALLLVVFTFLEVDPKHITNQSYRILRFIIIAGTGIYLTAEFAEISLSYWSVHSHQKLVFDLILFGPFFWVFWILHLGGSALYLWLLLRAESLLRIGLGGIIAAFVLLTSRLNILIPAQTLPNLEGLRLAFVDPRLQFNYQATITEYLVAIFIITVGTGLSYFALQLIPVLKNEILSEENNGQKEYKIFTKAIIETGSIVWRDAVGTFWR